MICNTPSPDGRAVTKCRRYLSSRTCETVSEKKRIVYFTFDYYVFMGGTISSLVEQKHDVHVAHETSGNIAVGDERRSFSYLRFSTEYLSIIAKTRVIVDKNTRNP